MNLNYESNDKIASEGSFSAPSLLATSPPSSLSGSLSLLLLFFISLSIPVLFSFTFSFFSQPRPSSFLVTEDSTASIFREKLRGKERKKVSNDDNTQFDKTDKGLN